MTQDEIDEIAAHARQIFNVLVAQITDPQHWDWHPVATRACEIAEEFALVLDERGIKQVLPEGQSFAQDEEPKTPLPPAIPDDWRVDPPGYAPTPPPDPRASIPSAYLPEATPMMPGPPPPPTPPSPRY